MGVHHVPLFLVVILGSFLQTTQDNPPITVKSCQHTDVLLQCNCSGMIERLRWQKINTTIYLNSSNTTSNNYTGRIRMFLNENPQNCSILLENIMKEDDGEYSCRFKGQTYSRSTVTLKVNINSTECPGVITQTVKRDNSTSNNDHRPEVYIPLIIISALLLVGCTFAVLWIQLRTKDQLRNQPIKTDEEAPLDCKNPVTLSEDSSDKKRLQPPLILALCCRADMDQE